MAYSIKILSIVSHKRKLDEYQAPAPAAEAVGPCLFAPEVPPSTWHTARHLSAVTKHG